MQLTLLTLSLDPETQAFPERPLAGIPGEVVSVVEHLFHHGGQPRLLLVVHWQPPRERGRPAPSGPDPRSELTTDERVVYDRLRAWRASRATADGVPPYVVLTNRQLADLARARPASLTALREVPGVGEAKAGKLGEELLRVLADAR